MSAPAVSLAPANRGEALIDAHSPLHAIVGFAAGILGVDPHVAMLTFIGARIVEAALKSGTKHALFGREEGQSLGNEMTDLLFELAGLHYGELLREKLTAEPAPAAGLGYPAHRSLFAPYPLTPNGTIR
jgi:hypothetical protein